MVKLLLAIGLAVGKLTPSVSNSPRYRGPEAPILAVKLTSNASFSAYYRGLLGPYSSGFKRNLGFNETHLGPLKPQILVNYVYFTLN